jgi:hypothetical protein
MFRKILLSTVLVSAGVVAMAQPVFIDSVENNNVGVPRRLGQGNEMYTYYIKGADNPRLKNASLVVKLTGAGMQESRTLTIDVDKNTNILSSAASAMGVVFMTYNTATKAASLLATDFSGGTVQKKTIEGISAEHAGWDSDIRLFAMMPEGYILVAPDAKKRGYTVTAYSNTLAEQWTERADQQMMEVVDAKMIAENLIVLRRELQDAKQQKYVYSLQSINTINHSDQQVSELKDEKNNYCYASAINEQDGAILLAGMCYKDGKFVHGLPAGVAVYEFEMNGRPMNKVFVDGQQLSRFLPDPVIAAMAMNSILHVTSVVNDNAQNVYCLAAEMMEKKTTNAKQAQANVTIGDLMTMVIGKDGELQKLTLADKSPRVAITLSGSPVGADIYGTAGWLQRNRLFNTKFAMHLADGYYVCTKSTDTTKNEVDAIFIRMDEPAASNQFSMAIGRTPTNDVGMKPCAKYTVVAGTTDKKMKRWLQADIYSIMGTQAVFFNQAEDKIVFYYDAIMKRNDK